MHRMIVVGGGAGGLELVTRLGDRLARRRNPKAEVTLVDMKSKHLWKPLLHEVAAGSIDTAVNQLEYAKQAQRHGFRFQQGALIGLNRARQQITVGAVIDDSGAESIPERILDYDTLILSIGSVTNFFNVPGADTHCFSLDNTQQAENFRKQLVAAIHKAEQGTLALPLRIAVIGAGSTGVELAAELRHATKNKMLYELDKLNPLKDIQITLIEAAPRILPILPERVAHGTHRLLEKLSIETKTSALVTQHRRRSYPF